MSPCSSAPVGFIGLTNEDVHAMCSRGHDHPKDDQARTKYSDISTAHEVGEGANEGADCCQGQKVGQDLSQNQYSDYITSGWLPNSQTMSIDRRLQYR